MANREQGRVAEGAETVRNLGLVGAIIGAVDIIIGLPIIPGETLLKGGIIFAAAGEGVRQITKKNKGS